MNVLPTVEDIRDYQFGSLVVSTDPQQQAMDKFVDALDLDEIEQEEGIENEVNVYNPTLQYFNQCVVHRIYNGEDSALPELNETIEAQARPEAENIERAQEQVEELESAFDLVEENKDEVRRRKKRIPLRDIIFAGGNQEEEKKEEVEQEVQPTEEPLIPEMSAEDKQRKFDFNNDEKVDKVSSTNPVRDFEKMITDREQDRVAEALSQMQNIILEFIRHSVQGDVYEKALDCLKAMRKACKDNDEAEKFNDFLAELKQRFSIGIHKEFFESIRNSNVGLITKEESFRSEVTKEQASEFLGNPIERVEQIEEAPEEKNDKKDDDIFDEIE